MSNFKYQNHNIHYEIYGEGKPLVILNGIMMSTISWHQFLQELSKNNRIILVDFIDQGKSDAYKGEFYTYSFQTEMLRELFDYLKLNKVNIASISYGGQIALDFSSKYPKRVEKLILFNTTSYINEWMTEIFDLWLAAGKTRNGEIYYRATIPTIYSSTFFKEQIKWMKDREKLLIPLFSDEVFLDKMERLVLSTKNLNLFEQLKNITADTLIVASTEDYLTPIKAQEEMHKEIKNSNYILIPNAGHASMYEKPKLFISLILGFINN